MRTAAILSTTWLITVFPLCLFVLGGCLPPSAGQCDDHGRLPTPEEWAAARERAGVLAGASCNPAYLVLVDDIQAELYGMGERTDAEWFQGYTAVCDGATVSYIRVDAEAKTLDHELLHAALLCSTGDGDPEHRLPAWKGLR